MKKINVTYFDNYNYDFDEFKEYYQKDNELNDEQMKEVSDSVIYNYIYSCFENDWDDLMSNLRYSDYADKPCVITGTLGLWNGHPTIEPVVCSNIEKAIRKCVNNMDYIIIKQVYGHLELTCAHHDGVNTFEIHLLNDKGIRANELLEWGSGKADLTNRCYYKSMNDYLY